VPHATIRALQTNFAFFLFDQDGSGSLTTQELVQIIKANHLTTDDAAAKRKAATIMKQADKDGTGSIDLEEFVFVASRFPNIVFPSFDAPPEDAASPGKAATGSARLTGGATTRAGPPPGARTGAARGGAGAPTA
jgi:hypothetical protein